MSEDAFKMAKQLARKIEKLFLQNLRAASAAGEFAGRDISALSKLLCAIDQGPAVYGFVAPSNKANVAIIAELDALLGVS